MTHSLPLRWAEIGHINTNCKHVHTWPTLTPVALGALFTPVALGALGALFTPVVWFLMGNELSGCDDWHFGVFWKYNVHNLFVVMMGTPNTSSSV